MNGNDTPAAAPAVKRERFFDHHMWWLMLLGIAGIFVYQTFKYQAFPNASIELKIPRLEIQEKAKKIAPTMGFNKTGLIESTVFHSDEEAKSFLEHEYSQEEANKLMLNEIPVWSWHTRLCKEFDQEEFQAWISPQGRLMSFEHDIPNDQALPNISHEAAKQKALDFVRKSETDADKFTKLVRDETFTKPKREDHAFTWENESVDYKGSRLRVYVYIAGDQVTEYNRYLHVPDKWEREYETIRSYNQLLGQCAFFFIYAFETAAFLVLIWGLMSKNIRWRPVIIGSLIMGGISALDYLNHMPSLIADYSPTTSYNDFIVRTVIWSFTGFIGNALMGAVLFGGGEICYRKLFPDHVSFEKILTKRGLSHQNILRGVLVGHFLVGVHLGWIVLYYVLGKHLHVWCPMGVESHEVLSNIVPFISAVALGVSASFEEELACRVLGIAIGTRLFKNFWLANIFQAVAWGFAHSSYPQEPAWARGVELSIVGVLQGWILKRYGIVAVITEHYLLDAFMDVESFLYSDVLTLKLSVFPALVPAALIVLSALALNKKVETSDDMDNDKIALLKPPPPAAEEAPPKIIYTPLSKRVRASMLALCVVSVLCSLFVPWTNGVNSDAKLNIGRDEAIASAREVMKKHNLDPIDWMETAYSGISGGGEAYQYAYEHTDAATLKKIFNETRQGFWYGVRFFKPMKAEEYTVYLDGTGKETSLSITRPEDDPGAKLTSDEARALAEKYLKEVHPEFPDYKLKQVSSKVRKNRLDYTVEFKYPKLKIAEADYLLSVSVIGDQVGNFRQWWVVPDSWSFERDKRTAKDEWLSHLRSATMFVAIVLCIIWAASVLRTGAIKFRAPILITCGFLVLTLLASLNEMVTFWSGYDTTTPVNSFLMSAVVAMISSLSAQAAGMFILLAIALGALRILCPRTPVVPYLKSVFGRNKNEEPEQTIARRSMWMDASLVAYGTLAFASIVGQLESLVSRAISPTVPFDSIGQIADLTEVYVPIIEVTLNAFKMMPFALCAAVLTAGLAAKFTPGFWRIFGAAVFFILVMPSGERYWQDYLIQVVEGVLLFLYFYVFAVKLARTNYITYIILAVMVSIAPYIRSILLNGQVMFVPELITMMLFACIPVLVVTGLKLKRVR